MGNTGSFNMEHGTIGGNGLLRLIGFTGICVGVAWALQILGFGGEASAFGRFVWVMAAASIAGAGAGLIMASSALQDAGRAAKA